MLVQKCVFVQICNLRIFFGVDAVKLFRKSTDFFLFLIRNDFSSDQVVVSVNFHVVSVNLEFIVRTVTPFCNCYFGNNVRTVAEKF
ncbi:hypothetical protein D3C80_1517560 [compost metagenome]